MPKAVSRDLALRTVPFVCLFNASQLRICILPRVIHSHARAERHLVLESVSAPDKQRDENAVGSLGRSLRDVHTRLRCSEETLDLRELERTLFPELYARALLAPREIARVVFQDLM